MSKFIDENELITSQFHPNVNKSICYAPRGEHIGRLKGSAWLAGQTIDSFLWCVYRSQNIDNYCLIMSISFATVAQKKHNTNPLSHYTSTWSLTDLHRDILIPAHVEGNHFVLYIVSYS